MIKDSKVLKRHLDDKLLSYDKLHDLEWETEIACAFKMLNILSTIELLAI